MGEYEPYHDYITRRLDEDDSPSLPQGKVIQYESGATREDDADKLDLEGFLSPLVMEAYAQYMHFHQKLPDGTMRAGSDWQNGIPFNRLMRSMWRHFKDCWLEHRLWPTRDGRVFNLCALLFNANTYLHQVLEADPHALTKAMHEAEKRREKARGKTKEKIGFLKGESDDA